MNENLLTSLIGQRISLPGHFDVPVILEDVRTLGPDGSAGYECRVRLPDGTLEEAVISPEEAVSISGIDRKPSTSINPVDAEKLRLFVESARIRLAYAHDSQFAVSLSGIRTLPHQIEAVYQRMLPQPRLRFLLADDPGAGKTIMAGLLIKEMKLREAIERILILCPAPLTIQWQDEMLRWFGEPFDIIFSAVDQQQLTNPWQRSSQVITSIDYAKQEDVRERVWQQRWDVVIIDEAHKCSARTASGGQGRELKVITTKRYDVVSRLVSQTEHILLLTATPHHGDEDKFAHFLRLIDPDLFPEPHRLGKQAETIRKEVLRLGQDCPWALRRLKEDLKELNGKRLFPDRHASTVTFCLNSEEYALYKAVTAYINEFIPQQTGQGRSAAALTRTVLQRRLASSTSAIHESLKRRLKKQQGLLEELEHLSATQRAKHLAALQGHLPDAEQEEDDLDDETRDKIIDEYTAALELEQLRTEVGAIKELVEGARKVREQGNDSKLSALQRCLTVAQFQELKDGRGKLLIFTEHRDTMSYVREHLERWGYSTCIIHGGMNPHERKHAQELFRTIVQVCVATEAAGEGINLQFCHLMINYDMPWNPTRLEQRLGRIHRIGQERDVYVFNFVATDSEDGQPIIEGRILHRLLQKLDQMNEALEGRVFDVIGEVLSLNDVNLIEMLREAAYDPRRLDEYIDQIDRIDPEKLKEYEKATGIALARSHVDFSGFQRRNLEIEEKRLMPRYVEAQFIASSREVGLRVEPRADGLWRIEHVLADLRSERLQFVRRLGKAEPSYRKITFHKHHLEQDAHIDAVLMGPGHPLYAAVDEKLNERLVPYAGGVSLYVDLLSNDPYRIHFFEISIRGKNTKGEDIPHLYRELVAVREQRGQFEIVPCDILLNLPSHPNPPKEIEPVDIQQASDFLKSTYQLECRRRCQEERQHFAGVCRDYLKKSFDARIKRSQERAMLLAAEAVSKPEYKLTSEEARKHVEELQRAYESRMEGLKRLEIARTGPVRYVATAIVLSPDADTATQLTGLADELDPNIRRKSEIAAEDLVVASLGVETLWAMGIAGADLKIAAVGAGMRAFTRFAKVEYANGEEVPAEKFLAEVEGVVQDMLMEKIIRASRPDIANGRLPSVSSIDSASRFYILWRYTYKTAEIDAGEAIVFTYGQHVELDGSNGLSTGNRALVEKKKGKYRLRDYTERGHDEKLGLIASARADGTLRAEGSLRADGTVQAALIDILHRILWLMENEPKKLPAFVDEARPDNERLRLIAEVLAGPGLSGKSAEEAGQLIGTTASEQAALGKLLANWRALIESRLAGRLI